MPYLFCRTHGPDNEASSVRLEDELRDEGECVLVVEGTLVTGPWRCDHCNAALPLGSRAWLKSAFTRDWRDDLVDYAFGYEREYFAMTAEDRVASYGAPWPDDSLHPGRIAGRIAEVKPPRQRAASATELFGGKSE